MSKLHSPLRYAVAAAALSSASATFALGLGEASISSTLGQPLEARIPITQLAGLNDHQLVVKVDAVWDDVTGTAMGGVDPRHLVLETSIDNEDSGVLRLRTRQALTEPFLNFVVTVRWPDGVIAREYTLLLDLPGAPTEFSSTLSRVDSAASTPTPVAVAAPRQVVAIPAGRPPSLPISSMSSEQPGGDRYVTRRGDSLWDIASALRSSLGGSIKERMAKIFANNPGAFVDGDPGLLKEQVELDLSPDALSSAASELPELDVAVAASSKASRSAPTSLPPGGGSDDDGASDDKLNAIRREISQVTDAMAQLSDKLADLQQQLREVSEQQGGDGSAEVDSPALTAAEKPEIPRDNSGKDSGTDIGADSSTEITAVAEGGNPNLAELPGAAVDQQNQTVSELQSENSYGQSVSLSVASQNVEDTSGDAKQISAAADEAISPTDGEAEAETAADTQRTDGEVNSDGWLRWLALPVVLILTLLWWLHRRKKEPMALAAEPGREAEPDWSVSAPRSRPRAPDSEEFGELFSELAQENRRDLPGTTSQSVRSAMDAPLTAAPPVSTHPDELATTRRSAFGSGDFAESSPQADAKLVFAETDDGLADLDFDDIDLGPDLDLDQPSSDNPGAEDIEAITERAAACIALADYTGARDILEAALQHDSNAVLQLQLLDVYAVQGASADFEALALQMEFDGADGNTLAEIQLIRDKLSSVRDSSDYNGRSA